MIRINHHTVEDGDAQKKIERKKEKKMSFFSFFEIHLLISGIILYLFIIK
jgi:hypothetical protein